MTEFHFEKIKKQNFIKDGILFGKTRATVSKRTAVTLGFDNWKRLDVYFDFKHNALGLKRNDEDGILAFQQSNRAFSTNGFSEKAKRGRYLFYQQEGDFFIFKFHREEIFPKGGEKNVE